MDVLYHLRKRGVFSMDVLYHLGKREGFPRCVGPFVADRASSKIAVIEFRLLSWKLRVGLFVPCDVLAFPLV
jgi:hypothetical protein